MWDDGEEKWVFPEKIRYKSPNRVFFNVEICRLFSRQFGMVCCCMDHLVMTRDTKITYDTLFVAWTRFLLLQVWYVELVVSFWPGKLPGKLDILRSYVTIITNDANGRVYPLELLKLGNIYLLGGFNPFWKVCCYARQIGSCPPSRGKHKKCLKPRPRYWIITQTKSQLWRYSRRQLADLKGTIQVLKHRQQEPTVGMKVNVFGCPPKLKRSCFLPQILHKIYNFFCHSACNKCVLIAVSPSSTKVDPANELVPGNWLGFSRRFCRFSHLYQGEERPADHGKLMASRNPARKPVRLVGSWNSIIYRVLAPFNRWLSSRISEASTVVFNPWWWQGEGWTQ